MGDQHGSDPRTPVSVGLTQVQADIGGLVDFRSFIGRELDLNLRPIVPVISEDHRHGAAWAGHVPSQAVFDARMRYYQAQQASLSNLARYLTAAEVLIETIHRIITVYREHELDLTGVMHVFSQVIADRDAAQAETHREAHRGGFG